MHSHENTATDKIKEVRTLALSSTNLNQYHQGGEAKQSNYRNTIVFGVKEENT